MAASTNRWVKARYRSNEPVMARDELPARELQDAVDDLSRQWGRRFNEAAPELASYFARRASRRSDEALRAILRRAGITVKFTMTRPMRDILRATIEQNVALIKSIPEQYLGQVQGSVMRSVQAGRDLGSLAAELRAHYGVTRRRAALIARTQNNMATASMTHARQTEIGIKEAIWLHSHAGKEPRPTHLANDGRRYKVDDGWYDSDPRVRRRIWPGELINCRCVSKPIVKGFS
jgi:SPP1 gp7 family putative phage head morphogenesis protein